MTLHPGAKLVLELIEQAEAEGRPPLEEMSPVEARAFYRDSRGALSPDPPKVALSQDFSVETEAGDVPVRYYRPQVSAEADKLPALVFFHGGGWVIGDPDTHDVVCRWLTNAGGFAVFSVDYRMGPEHKLPAAVDDCMAVTRWVADGAGGRAVDASRLAVCGDSAGGNLAAVVSIMARDGDGPEIAFQALIYPATDLHCATPSHAEFGEGHMLTAKGQRWFQAQYLESADQRTDWRVSPALHDDLSALPPALILTAGYDPLRDEGRAYADLLNAAGVDAAYSCYEGQIHGFVTMGKVIDEARTATEEVAAAVRAALTQ